MRRAPASALSVLLLTCGCARKDSRFFFHEIPDQLAYVGAVAWVPGSEGVVGTGLVRVDDNTVLELELDLEDSPNSVPLLLVGFEGLPTGAPDEALLGQGHIRLAAECEPALVPDWTTEVPVSAPILSRPLTVDWLGSVCPKLQASSRSIDVSCVPFSCEKQLEQTECSLALDLTQCNLEPSTIRARVHYDGSLCVEGVAASSCSTEETPEWAFGRIECEDPTPCLIHLYPETSTASADLLVESVKIVDVEPLIHPDGFRPAAGHLNRSRTYLGDLLELRNPPELVVSSFSGDTPNGYSAEAGPSTLSFVDVDSLDIVRSATAPGGLFWLTEDPESDGFIGAFRDGPIHVLGRFGRDGSLTSSRAVSLDHIPSDQQAYTVVDFEYVAEIGSIVALFQTRSEALPWRGAIIRFDSVTLEELFFHRFGPADDRFSGFEMSSAGELVVGVEEPVKIVWLDSELRSVTTEVAIDPTFRPRGIGPPLFHHETDRLFVPVGVSLAGVYRMENKEVTARAAFFESDGWPVQMVSWTPDLLLTAVTTGEGPEGVRTFLAYFDPVGSRFLPGAKEVGRGGPTRLCRGKAGRIWVALGSSAEVVRVTRSQPVKG